MQAYCVKCRTKKEMTDTKSITMKNVRPATQGVCPDCGTKMFRIGKGQSQFLSLPGELLYQAAQLVERSYPEGVCNVAAGPQTAVLLITW